MNYSRNKGFIGATIAIIIAIGALALTLFKEAPPASAPSAVSANDLYGATYSPVAGKVYRLKNSISGSITTINLDSFKDPVSNIPYTMPLLGSTIQYGTLEPRNPNKVEFVSFTGITQNPDGTATLTGVTRGLPGFNVVAGGCTASTTLQQSHGGQSEFILANNPCQISEYPLKNYNDTVTGYWSIPTPLTNSNPATKAYVDGLVNGGAVSNARITVAAIAGETVATGTIVYLKQADARWYKAGVTIPEASTTPIGVSQGNGTSGNAIASGVLLYGLDEGQSGLTAGMNYFVGPTAGAASLATSTRVIGRARDATTLYVYPDFPVSNNDYFVKTHFGSTTQAANLNITTASTTFLNTASSSVRVAATSSLQIGSEPAYNIGKHIQVFAGAATSTFQVPEGISRVCVEAVGGGGGGGGSNTSAATGGGGGGAYARGCFDVTGVATVEVKAGDPGVGGTNAPTNGFPGGNSTFGTNGFYLIALGGQGGGSSGAASGGIGGATSSTAYFNVNGGTGSLWVSDASSNDAGCSFFGCSTAYGTGGKGRGNSGTGPAGNRGVVIVYY